METNFNSPSTSVSLVVFDLETLFGTSPNSNEPTVIGYIEEYGLFYAKARNAALLQFVYKTMSGVIR